MLYYQQCFIRVLYILTKALMQLNEISLVSFSIFSSWICFSFYDLYPSPLYEIKTSSKINHVYFYTYIFD